MKKQFIQVVPCFGVGHANGGYLRGKSATGEPIRHRPQLTVYATETGVELTPELAEQIKLMGSEFCADVVIPLSQLSELNRQPSLVFATVVQLTVKESAAAGPGAAESNGKPLDKWNKDQLLAKCAELEIDPAEGSTNAQLIELIKAKRAG